MLNVFMSFNFYRNTANHQDDLVCMLGNILVHPTLQIGEAALHRIFTHPTRANFVSDKDESGVLLREAVKLSLEGGENS